MHKPSPEAMTAISAVFAAIELFRKLDPDMPIQVAATFLAIAKDEGLSLREIQERTGQAQSSASRNVTALGEVNRHGKPGLALVTSRPSPEERRRNEYTLTPKGRQVLHSITSAVQAAVA